MLRILGDAVSRDVIAKVRRADLDGLELEVTTTGTDVEDHVADVIAGTRSAPASRCTTPTRSARPA